jgi:hypothetical protein
MRFLYKIPTMTYQFNIYYEFFVRFFDHRLWITPLSCFLPHTRYLFSGNGVWNLLMLACSEGCVLDTCLSRHALTMYSHVSQLVNTIKFREDKVSESIFDLNYPN